MSSGHVHHPLDAVLLVAATVTIHSTGVLLLVWSMAKGQGRAEERFGYLRSTFTLTAVVVFLLMLHLLEVGMWALFYDLQGCFNDWATSVYFSLETYATVGYGDVVLGKEWRLLGGVEALTGVLMLSWSTAVLLGLVNWIVRRHLKRWGMKIAR